MRFTGEKIESGEKKTDKIEKKDEIELQDKIELYNIADNNNNHPMRKKIYNMLTISLTEKKSKFQTLQWGQSKAVLLQPISNQIWICRACRDPLELHLSCPFYTDETRVRKKIFTRYFFRQFSKK